ncbi:complex I assembly factor ACAD9, mitochondrial-like [Chelonus insularis]|uniref:complex I assembly factor ACAD9, mitochondrial-like n=1 Tax=Chelonus insularis TaxID=460826 RepID=UPI00158CD7A0|nr:complex I assembly factor ACAD9, mitochondrial-like [Chelonus insularis]
MLTRRLINKYKLPQFICVIPQLKQFSSNATDPSLFIPPEVRLSAPKPLLPEREPFVKNFFLAKYDTHFAAFPEPQTPDRHRDFFEWLKPIEDYIYNKVDSAAIDRTAQIPNEILENLRNLGVFQAIVPDIYHGIGLNSSEIAKLVETVSYIPCLGAYLVKQIAAVQLISELGSDKQKQLILPRIANRDLIPTICITEDFQGMKGSAITSVARRLDCNDFYLFNSIKTFVPNAENSNLFIVFAECSDPELKIEPENTISAFLIQKDCDGLEIKEPVNITGLRGFSLSEVHFKNTKIPADNMLGITGSAANKFSELYVKGKEYIGCQAIGLLKRFLKLFVLYLKKQEHFNTTLFQNDSVQETIAKIACIIYAMESIVYFTNGMIDGYAGQNCDIEKCIIEVYCTEKCIESILLGIQFLGAISHVRGSELDQLIRDALCLTSIDGPVAPTKLLIAMLGLKHSGHELAENIVVRRNPVLFPGKVFKHTLFNWNKEKDLYVDDNLHPTLQPTAKIFETLLKKFSKDIYNSCARDGQMLMAKEMELKRISESAILLYVLAAILARSSRSYCLGMRNSEQEIQMAQVYGYILGKELDKTLYDIEFGEHIIGDFILKNVSDTIFENDNYVSAHPLARNF